jgi:uncharacterized membrane protein
MVVSGQSIGDAMMYIADKLNLTVEQVYQVYLRAQVILAIIQIVEIVIFVIGVVIIGYICFEKYKKAEESCTFSNADLKYFMIGFVATLLLGIVLLALYDPIVALTCPEYAAMQAMIHNFASIVK